MLSGLRSFESGFCSKMEIEVKNQQKGQGITSLSRGLVETLKRVFSNNKKPLKLNDFSLFESLRYQSLFQAMLKGMIASLAKRLFFEKKAKIDWAMQARGRGGRIL